MLHHLPRSSTLRLGAPLVGLALLALLLAACASGQKTFDGDGGPDDAARASDAGLVDAVPGAADAAPGAADAAPGAPDAAPLPDATPGTDASPTGAYLDRCTSPGNCVSGLCETDVGGSMFCSKSCTTDAQCAHEHLCMGSKCIPDDTGAPCSVGTPETCNRDLCLGAGDGTGQCTKPCAAASECPAGYACTTAGGSITKICVNIEKPCATANNCGSGLCLSVQGCTSFCDSVADCPARLPFLPAYTCAIAFGSASPICVPPADIAGNQAAGAICQSDGAGGNLCRSGACDTSATAGPMCTQSCSANSGCAPGLGCFPLADSGDINLVCNRAGSKDLGVSCAAAADCHSGLCDATGLYCTRLCNDGLCPTGWTCQPVAGYPIAICRQ